jgi:hypothetical protein
MFQSVFTFQSFTFGESVNQEWNSTNNRSNYIGQVKIIYEIIVVLEQPLTRVAFEHRSSSYTHNHIIHL